MVYLSGQPPTSSGRILVDGKLRPVLMTIQQSQIFNSHHPANVKLASAWRIAYVKNPVGHVVLDTTVWEVSPHAAEVSKILPQTWRWHEITVPQFCKDISFLENEARKNNVIFKEYKWKC